MSYLYAFNSDPHNRYEQIEFLRDDGSTAELTLGLRYDLSPTEIARLVPFIALQYSPLPASGDPIGVYRIPIKGNPSEGQVPVWRADEAAFVPEALSLGSDGGSSSALSGVVGGASLITNPSFHDGVTGYTAAAGSTVTANGLLGLFGSDAAVLARSSSTGDVVLTSPRVPISPGALHSASSWIKLSTLGTSTARQATIAIRWYSPSDVLITSNVSASVAEAIDGKWTRLGIASVLSPDTAAKAEVRITIAAVPTSENHVVDGVQLEVGDVTTSFGLALPTSTIVGDMLAPATLTTREISTSLIDAIVAAAAAIAAPVGLWDFPYTIDPRLGSANGTVTANNVYYYRVQGKGTITKIALNLGTTDGAGTVAVGVHRNSGSGRAARPTALVTQGSAATTPTGYREIALGASVDVNHGDWFSLTTNSATASFLRSVANATTTIADGLTHSQTGGGGTSIPSTPGTLFSNLQTLILVGVA